MSATIAELSAACKSLAVRVGYPPHMTDAKFLAELLAAAKRHQRALELLA
jgi:hypothetical protein